MPRLAARTHAIEPFRAVNMLQEASALEAAGHDIISLGIGEPDFTAPPPVVDALHRAAAAGLSGYSSPRGLPALRRAIAGYYRDQFGAHIDPERVLVTNGASGALWLAALALVNPGDEILMPDPCYPANRNFITAAGGVTRLVTTSAANRYQLSANDVARHWRAQTRGVLIASPSNPTGTAIPRAELAALLAAVRARGGVVLMDEIYLGLSYETEEAEAQDHPKSALTLDDDVIVINSFSKYFHMTGWRLGWLIVPPEMVEPLERMAGSLTICASTLAQHAALACFAPDALAIFAKRRELLRQRRDYLMPELERLDLAIPAKPDGAFYLYADVSRHLDEHTPDSAAFAARLLREAGVVAIAGEDFGPAHARTMLRFSYATGMDRLQEAVARMARMLGQDPR